MWKIDPRKYEQKKIPKERPCVRTHMISAKRSFQGHRLFLLCDTLSPFLAQSRRVRTFRASVRILHAYLVYMLLSIKPVTCDVLRMQGETSRGETIYIWLVYEFICKKATDHRISSLTESIHPTQQQQHKIGNSQMACHQR